MYIYFEQLFDILNNNDNHIVIMAVYLSLFALALVLRGIVCMGYRSALFAFRQGAKELKTREDIKKIKNGAMRKIAAEYIRLADRSVSRIPTSALVERQVSSMSLLGWRYISVMPFVESLDIGLIFVGLVLATVFTENAFMYGVLAAGGFALTRIAAAFFDFRSAKQLLTDEILIYTEREIGHFYTADTGGAVLRLKNELSDAIAKQSEVLKETVDRFGQLMSDAVGSLGTGIADAVDKKLVDMNTGLQQSMQDWEKALADAGRVQGLINTAAERMQAAGDKLGSSADLLSRYMQGHSNALSDHLGALVSAVEAVKDVNDRFGAEMDAFMKQSKYIETNQTTLDATVQSYETALQELTRHLGDGLGTYLQLHAQTASQNVNETLSANLEKILLGNTDMVQRLTALFDQLREQNRDVSANLLTIHEKLAGLEGGEATP